MNTEKNFVDDLMNKAFDLSAPEMPDFAKIDEKDEIMELDFEQLEYLNAAGALEIQLNKSQKKNDK